MTNSNTASQGPAPNMFSVWWSATRPQTLAAGVAPVVVGVTLASQLGPVDIGLAALCMLGALLLQVTSNLANDVFDFLKGADGQDRIGPARATQQGVVSPRAMLVATGIVATLALAVGVTLMRVGGWPIVVIGLSGLACAVLYTGGPKPLGYLGLGDACVFLFFGLAAVGGTVWVLRPGEPIRPTTWLAACALGALATAILVVNNLRDRHTDARAGKRTLAVRLGARAARLEWTLCVVMSFLCLLVAALLDSSWGWLPPLLAAPHALRLARRVWTVDGQALNPLLGATARLELLVTALLCAGLMAQRLTLVSSTGGTP